MCGISGMISGESISSITISRVEEINNSSTIEAQTPAVYFRLKISFCRCDDFQLLMLKEVLSLYSIDLKKSF